MCGGASAAVQPAWVKWNFDIFIKNDFNVAMAGSDLYAQKSGKKGKQVKRGDQQ
jgi:hypothetical protein